MIELINQKKTSMVLVGGVRVKRKDNIARLWASSFAKHCRFLFLKDKHPDSGQNQGVYLLKKENGNV